MVEITSSEKFSNIINEENVLVDFYADWCGPCQMMSELLKDEEENYPNIRFTRLNTDRFQLLAQKYNVSSIPTLIVFSNGKIIKQKTGFLRREELNEFLK